MINALNRKYFLPSWSSHCLPISYNWMLSFQVSLSTRHLDTATFPPRHIHPVSTALEWLPLTCKRASAALNKSQVPISRAEIIVMKQDQWQLCLEVDNWTRSRLCHHWKLVTWTLRYLVPLISIPLRYFDMLLLNILKRPFFVSGHWKIINIILWFCFLSTNLLWKTKWKLLSEILCLIFSLIHFQVNPKEIQSKVHTINFYFAGYFKLLRNI